MPLQATSGAASYDSFGGGVAAVPQYIEDVFSTYLYTGNGSTQTITNGIDLSTKGGLVWGKNRLTGYYHLLTDSNRGVTKQLYTSETWAEGTDSTLITSLNSNGFTLGSGSGLNQSGNSYVSWTFREAPKFFDVVTWTKSGTSNATISHNLNSVPGCIIIKRTNDIGHWYVYHRSLTLPNMLELNYPDAQYNGYNVITVAPTSTTFQVQGASLADGNYVAYLFAHNAGGFGLTGTDNVISCGSFTTDSSGNATVNLGYEPQYILMKKTSGVQNWVCYDTMRGWAQAQQAQLYPNITQAEDVYSGSPYFFPTATGFSLSGTFGLGNNDTFIYIAIRRGPMKVPTSGTSVFKPNTYTGTGAVLPITGMGFPPDFLLTKDRQFGNDWCAQDKLRGPSQYLRPNGTIAELNLGTAQLVSIDQNGVTYGSGSSGTNFSGSPYINLSFRRAPNTFDEVCFKGTGSAQNISHNLGVAPEFMMVKERNGANSWYGYAASEGATKGRGWNSSNAFFTASSLWNDTTPTSSVFTVGTAAATNGSGQDFVAYLWATNAGVTKVGSYTGNGSSQTINCGFTGGSRFVLIKRTDDVGDWYVWDSARGIVSGNDPHLSLNSTAVEVTTDDTIDTDSTGFIVNQVSATNCNVNGASYIFLSYA